MIWYDTVHMLRNARDPYYTPALNVFPRKFHTLIMTIWTPYGRYETLVVKLARAARADGIKVVVALEGSSLSRLHRAWSTFTKARAPTPIARRRRQAAVVAVTPVAVLPVIGTRSVVEPMSPTSHRPAWCPSAEKFASQLPMAGLKSPWKLAPGFAKLMFMLAKLNPRGVPVAAT